MNDLVEWLRAFNDAVERTMRHPLKAVQDWWRDGEIEYPPRRSTGGRRG